MIKSPVDEKHARLSALWPWEIPQTHRKSLCILKNLKSREWENKSDVIVYFCTPAMRAEYSSAYKCLRCKMRGRVRAPAGRGPGGRRRQGGAGRRQGGAGRWPAVTGRTPGWAFPNALYGSSFPKASVGEPSVLPGAGAGAGVVGLGHVPYRGFWKGRP